MISGLRRLPIAVDVMGADDGISPIVDGAIRAASMGISVVLVGDSHAIRAYAPDIDIPILHADDVFRNDEPARAVRNRRGSSVWMGAELVANGEASALVSCGHSGALVVAAFGAVGTVADDNCLAIAAVLPTLAGGHFILLDAGANIDCKPQALMGFAKLGTAYAKLRGVSEPTVGILTNGHEPNKGNELVRATLALSEDGAPVSLVEPRDVLSGAVDVVVCDGFMGNIFLKTMEALVPRSSDGIVPIKAGGLLLGLDGVVVVGHGLASPDDVLSAIQLADEVVCFKTITAANS